jgi:RNA polymerase sigma-70 factor (ECF subfamily)
MEQPDEADLLERAKRGEATAFAQALSPYLAMLHAYSRAICGDFHAAQDVVQETALVAYKNLHHLFPEADFSLWLRAIARRQALAARRKLTRLPLVALEILESVYDEPRLERTSARQDMLVRCLGALSGRMSKIVRAYYFDGSALADIATSLEMSTQAVKQLLYRARLWLRQCVERRLETS